MKRKDISHGKENSDFALIKENATRVSRILKDEINQEIKENLFAVEEEKNLYNAIKMHNSNKENLEEYIISLKSLIQPTAEFFDKVLVMDKDENIKNNRLALLKQLKDKFSAVCMFEKL